MKKKFKALMIDCDGTLFPTGKDGFPSEKVIHAINQASKLLHVGIATQRALFSVQPTLTSLRLSGPSIISGGAQIIDARNFQVLWEKPIDKKDFFTIMRRIKKIRGKIVIQEDDGDDKEYKKNCIPKKVLELGVFGLEQMVAHQLFKDLSDISTISVHQVSGWQPSQYGVAITHALATKQHGIFEVAKILNINTHEIIAIGDGYNDFPLLMACGLKVAMGNAVDDLKAIADYIAPTVEEDGVVDVINKFVIS